MLPWINGRRKNDTGDRQVTVVTRIPSTKIPSKPTGSKTRVDQRNNRRDKKG